MASNLLFFPSSDSVPCPEVHGLSLDDVLILAGGFGLGPAEFRLLESLYRQPSQEHSPAALLLLARHFAENTHDGKLRLTQAGEAVVEACRVFGLGAEHRVPTQKKVLTMLVPTSYHYDKR
jgi:hypothetical protein